MKNKNSFILLFIALIAVSSSSWVVRFLSETSAITLAFWRMFLASFFMFIFSYKTFFSFVPTKKIALSGFFLGIHFCLFFKSVQLSSIAEASLLGTIAPVFTMVYLFLWENSRPSLFSFLGLFFALAGSFLVIISPGDSVPESRVLGNLLAVGCSVAMAGVLIVGKKVRTEIGLMEFSRWLFFFASVTIFIIAIFFNVNIFCFNKTEFTGFIFLALIPTLVGHNIFYYLIKSLNPTTVAAIPLGEPFVSSLGGFYFFGEIVSPATVMGGTITLVGLYLIIRFND